jgi:hypothetical protein
VRRRTQAVRLKPRCKAINTVVIADDNLEILKAGASFLQPSYKSPSKPKMVKWP